MSTPGTPDPASEPIEPSAADGARPAHPDPMAAPPAGSYGQPGPAYAQGASEQPSGRPYAGPAGSGQPASGAAVPLSPSDERLWATLGHVGGILVGFLAPLVVWLVFRERSRFVDDQGKEALNFQILLAIVYVVGGITSGLVIGFFIVLVAWILAVVFGIQAAITANRGELYRYPLSWRIVK